MTRTVTRRGIERRYEHLGVEASAVPDGWLHLLEDCLAEIDRHTPESERGAVRVSDVKEKHNRLSILAHAGAWVDDIVDLYESMSEFTCARCAAPVDAGAVYCPACDPKKGGK